MELYYPCCGKSICNACIISFFESCNQNKCPFCNAEKNFSATHEEQVADIMKRVAANDPGAIFMLGARYYDGLGGVQQDQNRAVELWRQAAKLGSFDAHFHLGHCYEKGGNLKKAKFHYEAAAMEGHGMARFNLALLEAESGNLERAVKHLTIAACTGEYLAMHQLTMFYEKGYVRRESFDSTLSAYNNSCVEMRSEARDNLIQMGTDTNESIAARGGRPDEVILRRLNAQPRSAARDEIIRMVEDMRYW
jgi:TPR repeat protein